MAWIFRISLAKFIVKHKVPGAHYMTLSSPCHVPRATCYLPLSSLRTLVQTDQFERCIFGQERQGSIQYPFLLG